MEVPVVRTDAAGETFYTDRRENQRGLKSIRPLTTLFGSDLETVVEG